MDEKILIGLRLTLSDGFDSIIVAVFSSEQKAIEHALLYAAKLDVELNRFALFETRLDPAGTCPSNVAIEGTCRHLSA